MKVTAILPIRAQSQRVKNKNILQINGKPLYYYILNTLKQCQTVNTILINTDYENIHNEFRHDPQVILMDRADYLKGNCDINLVIESVLNEMDGNYFLQTHATNPLLKSSTIDKSVKRFFEGDNKYDSLFSVTKIQKRFWSMDGVPLNHSIADEPTTQNLKPYYEENSNFYIFSRTSFIKAGNKRIGVKPYMYEIDKLEATDIDDMEDFILAEALMKIRNEKI